MAGNYDSGSGLSFANPSGNCRGSINTASDNSLIWYINDITETAGYHTHNGSIGYSGDTETRPRNVSLHYMIKY